MAIVKEVRLSFTDVEKNNNKFWFIRLFDNDDVETEWGRIRSKEDKDDPKDGSQSKLFKSAGQHFLDKKVREKLTKGYTELKLAGVTLGNKVATSNNLQTLAKKQIVKKSNPILDRLIDDLVKANVHNIVSSTNIRFSDATGLFSTPLGIVTQEAIDAARDELLVIKNLLKMGYGDKDKLFKSVNTYLRLIPQDVGYRVDVDELFPDADAIVKQNDILDSLEASLEALGKTPSTPTTDQKDQEEKVFDVDLNILEDGGEIDRINKFFRSTIHGVHASSRLKIAKIYTITIATMLERFKKCQLGNEMTLWHGTKKANLLSILRSGLKKSPPSSAAITGKMFGNGIYFSDQSTKSLNYSYGYWDGKYENDCFMLLNRVKMGNFYVPRNCISRPPAGYDSIFAKAGQSGVSNNEMIVFDDSQVNVTHLVEFK